MHRISTEIVIPAPAGRVWAVLADFARYSEWNPLNLEVRGEARIGTAASMVFRNLAVGGDAVIRQTGPYRRGRARARAGMGGACTAAL